MRKTFQVAKNEALTYWQNIVSSPERAYELFAHVAQLRRTYLGGTPWLTAGSGGLFPCRIHPRCGYCSFYSEEHFSLKALLLCLEKLEELGYRQFHISGGTDLDGGFEDELLEMLRQIQQHCSIGIEVNLGPSFSKEALVEMKRLGVESVTSSLEFTNPAIFSATKPGDSLEKRISLLEACEELGIASRSMMLIGLGESMEDRIDHLLLLRSFPHLYQLRISRFMPFSGTLYSNYPRCSTWELALTVALARLILPDREISLGAGNSDDDIPLWYLAGGGNQLVGAFVSAKERPKRPGVDVYCLDEHAYVIDSRKAKEHILEGMGFSDVGFLPRRD